MNLKFLTLLTGVVCLAFSGQAQDNFTFQNQLRDTIHLNIDNNDIGSHYLGQQLAVKYYRLKETYTYVEASSVSDPVDKTVVTKPEIYYSLKKLNSHYRKQLKKGAIDSSSAVKELGWYFDIGFAIYEQNTDDFEKALKDARKPEQIAGIFAQVILE